MSKSVKNIGLGWEDDWYVLEIEMSQKKKKKAQLIL